MAPPRYGFFERAAAAALAIGVAMTTRACPQTPPRNGATSDTMYTIFTANSLHDFALMYREFRTEFLQCLYGTVRGDTVLVRYGIAADVKPSHSLATTVIPQRTGQCPITGDSLVGVAHSHPQTCQGGNGAACGLVVKDSGAMHPQDDPGNDPCFESWPDIRTFMASGLDVNVVVCGVGRLYVQRKGNAPNDRRNVVAYDPELDLPTIVRAR